MLLVLAIALGFLLDSILGDDENMWHPVCGIGWLISSLEKTFRRIPLSSFGERFFGFIMWLIVCFTSYAVPAVILGFAYRIHSGLYFVIDVILCYQVFARKCLADAGYKVMAALAISLQDGRKEIAKYVGRDTSEMSEKQIIKATIETIAENTTDGVIAPLFFMLIGGAPLGFLYKAVNTLDSMVGYKNAKYEHFGWFSAKADDVFNFLPARIAAMFLLVAAGMLKFDTVNARRIFQRDRFAHKSPNAGQTESICAGALHIQLGGDAKYFGKVVKKPTIGDADREIFCSDIKRTIDMMTSASVFALLFGISVKLALMGSF